MKSETTQNNYPVPLHDLKKELKIRVLTSESELRNIQVQWDKLVDVSESTIYQKSYWLFTWWKYYHNPLKDRIFCLTIYDNETLVGIIPLYINNVVFLNKIIFKRLYFIGSNTIYGDTFGLFNDNSPSDYFDIICHPEYEAEVVKTFFNYISNNKHLYDEIILTNLNTKSTILKYLHDFNRDSNLTYSLKEGEICPYIQTPETFEDFLNSRSQSVKRRFSQSWKEARSGKMFKIEKISSFGILKVALEQIKELHQTKWNRTGFPGFFGDIRYEKFFTEFIEASFDQGIIWCATASNNEQIIAGRLAFKYKNKFYDYLSGIDDRAQEAKRRPGLVLLMEMINDAIKEKIQFIDLLRGDEPYKKDFTNIYERNWNLRIYKKDEKVYKAIISFPLILKFLRILYYREISLLKIWIKVYGIPSGSFNYFKTRIKALFKKLKKLIIRIKI